MKRVLTCWLILYFGVLQLPTVQLFLLRPKEFHQMINDPFQVKQANITIDNLFGWLNMKNHVKFKVWTRKNPKLAQEIKLGNVQSLQSTNFDTHKLTKVLVHGFAHSANEIYLEDWIVGLRDAYLHMADVNVLIIDYTLFALPSFYLASGPNLASEMLAEMLKFLVSQGADWSTFHMLGYSWGAHVAGNAGHLVHGRVGRITGLDPANPLFRLVDNELRLDKSDAQYVDIIHTNGGGSFLQGFLGLHDPLGHADFYPNAGRDQPGCPKQVVQYISFYETIECDHGRSVKYFEESVTSPFAFEACHCENWVRYFKGHCPCLRNDMTFMGEHSPHTTRGLFFLFTRDRKPFGLGPQSDISMPDIDEYDNEKWLVPYEFNRGHSTSKTQSERSQWNESESVTLPNVVKLEYSDAKTNELLNQLNGDYSPVASENVIIVMPPSKSKSFVEQLAERYELFTGAN